MDWIWITFVIIIFLYLVILVGSYVVFFHITLAPEKRGYDWTYTMSPKFIGLQPGKDYQEFFLPVKDNQFGDNKQQTIHLHTLYLPPKKGAKKGTANIVLAHMFQRRKEQILGLALSLNRLGHGVVLFDFRAHGLSTAQINGISSDKLTDLQALLHWLEQKEAQEPHGKKGKTSKRKTILHGFSMGASVSLRAAATLKGIDGVILDSPYLNMTEMLRHHIRHKYKLPASLILRPQFWLTKALWGIQLDDHFEQEVQILIAQKLPALLIYGDRDHVVPVKQQEQMLQRLAGHAQTWVCADSGHYGCFFKHYEEYMMRVQNFIGSL